MNSPKYSAIIPYQHSEERLLLLYACLKRLTEVSADHLEICIHEMGPVRKLHLPKKYKYCFTKHSSIFHRAWALNKGVRKLATGNMLLLMDSDLIVEPKWINELLSCTELSIAWGKLSWLNKKGTEQFLKTKYINRVTIEETKTPSMGRAAGAMMLIPKQLFYSMKGIPEDFAGSWGGEDNAFWAKLKKLGNTINKFNSEIFHLYHSQSTPRVTQTQRKAHLMIRWTEEQWKEHSRIIGDNWGSEFPDSFKSSSVEIIDKEKGPKVTFAMLSWLRYDTLLNTLKSLHNTLTIPINMSLMVQDSKRLSIVQKQVIQKAVNNFAGNKVHFTNGNLGAGPAKAKLSRWSLNSFSSPYIILADDDTTFTKGSVEAALKLLDEDLSLGVVCVRYMPKIFRLDSSLNPTKLILEDAKDPIEYVDNSGYATAFIRREVFDTCLIDPHYVIGLSDLDFFSQVRTVGWKIVNYEAFDGMKAINAGGGCLEYRKFRTDRAKINESKSYFEQKWGITVR